MRIWIDVSPWSWAIWPLWGSYVYTTYPAPEKTIHHVDLGPLRLCWERLVA
jgi:hypothetical protein